MRIDRNRFKRLVAPVALAIIAVGVTVVIAGAAVLQRRATEGADPADALVEVPEGVPALGEIVFWAPDGPPQERVVEPATRRALEAAWTRAWHALQRSSAGDPSLLDTWFAGPALEQVTVFRPTDGEPVRLDLGRHVLRVDFYSDDGSIIGLRADPVRISRTFRGPAGPRTRTTDETYDVVMLLEDGNWRIRQWERTAVAVVDDDS